MKAELILLENPVVVSDEQPNTGELCLYNYTDIMPFDGNHGEIWNPELCKKIIMHTPDIDISNAKWGNKHLTHLKILDVEVEEMLQVRHGTEWYDLPNQKEGRDREGIYRKVLRITKIL